jgi:hypothetical protein
MVVKLLGRGAEFSQRQKPYPSIRRQQLALSGLAVRTAAKEMELIEIGVTQERSEKPLGKNSKSIDSFRWYFFEVGEIVRSDEGSENFHSCLTEFKVG